MVLNLSTRQKCTDSPGSSTRLFVSSGTSSTYGRLQGFQASLHNDMTMAAAVSEQVDHAGLLHFLDNH